MTKVMYEYTVFSIALTVPILVVASGDASTDRIASRKSPFIGAFFGLKIEYEFGGPCAMHHQVAEHDAIAVLLSFLRAIGSAQYAK
jgi:hypothetical protein